MANTLNKEICCLIDAGFEDKMGYAGDLSSTFPVSRQFNSAQKEIYPAHPEAIRGKPFRHLVLAYRFLMHIWRPAPPSLTD